MPGSSTTSSSSSEKRVSFSEIEILEFHYILGDNPAVSCGAPVALGPDLVKKATCEVDYYEDNRGKRKSRKKLALPVQTRAQILLQQGYSLESIASATMAADEISRERMNSAQKQNWDRMSEIQEKFGRYLRKAMGRRGPPEKSTVAANSA